MRTFCLYRHSLTRIPEQEHGAVACHSRSRRCSHNLPGTRYQRMQNHVTWKPVWPGARISSPLRPPTVVALPAIPEEPTHFVTFSEWTR